jgi:hypothetical protein
MDIFAAFAVPASCARSVAVPKEGTGDRPAEVGNPVPFIELTYHMPAPQSTAPTPIPPSSMFRLENGGCL